jgi:hypothetical protein
MFIWKSLCKVWYISFPYAAFVGMTNWGLSYSKHALMLCEDSYMQYNILHIGPFEFFIRKRSVALDFF